MRNSERVLVTGADGFIGSHLVEALVSRGYKVKAFVQYNSFSSWGWLDSISNDILQSIEIFEGDIRDPNGVRTAMADVTSVLHLAALIAIPYSYHSPDTYVATNVNGTLNVLQAAKQFGIDKVVHTSTSETYGTALTVPISESHPLQGQSPYSATKIAADQLAYSFYCSFNLPVSIVRPFNTYGPRQSARAVIPSIIIQLLAGKQDLELGSLSPTRDFNFVEDTVSGFIRCLESSASVGEVINIGSGFEVSIGDLVDMISSLMDKEVNVVEDKQRFRPIKSEVNRLLCDNSKARQLLEWTPTYAGFDGLSNGLSATIDWFAKPENIAKYKLRYNI